MACPFLIDFSCDVKDWNVFQGNRDLYDNTCKKSGFKECR